MVYRYGFVKIDTSWNQSFRVLNFFDVEGQ